MGTELKNYTVSNNGIFYAYPRKNVQITNFSIVIKRITVAKNVSKFIQILNLEFSTPTFAVNSELTFEQLVKFDPASIDVRLCLFPGRDVRELFICYIQLLAATVEPTEKYWIDTLGGNYINGHHVYCAGNILLGDTENLGELYITPEVQAHTVYYDTNIKPKEAFSTFLHLLDIEEGVTDIIGLFIISGFMSELFRSIDLPDNSVLFVTGSTQSRKTSLLSLSSGFYNHDDDKANVIRLDSSLFGIQDFISDFRNATSVVDDLFRTSDSENIRKAQTILRQKADGTPRYTSNSKIDISETTLAMTSEFLLDNISDIGRTILILLKHPIDSKKLAYRQARQNDLVAFYVNFIDWVYKNFEELQQLLREDKAKFEYERQQTHIVYERIREHTLLLKLSLKYTLKYAESMGLINARSSSNILILIEKNIESTAEEQLKIMDYIAKKSGERPLNPSKALYYALKHDAVHIGDEGSDCFLRHNKWVKFLWIKTEKLTFELNKIFGYEFTCRYYIKYFLQKGILIREPSGNKNTKRFNGQRYMVLRLDILEHEAGSLEGFVDGFLNSRT